MSGILGQVASSLGTLRTVFTDPDLRKLELTWLFTWTADLASAVALAVYAYDRGGTAMVGVMALARALPAAIAAAPASALADRRPRRLVLAVSVLGRGAFAALLAAGLVLGGPMWLVLILAAVDGTLSAAFWPAQSSLAPELARSPEQLVATNVASSIIESVAIVAGPIGAALLLHAGGPTAVLIVAALFQCVAAVEAWRIRRTASRPEEADPSDEAGLIRSFVRSVGWVMAHPDPRLVFVLSSVRTMAMGGLGVFVVLLSIQTFGLGDQGVGLLNAAVGVGGMVGAGATLLLVGRRAAAVPFGWSALACSIPLILLGLGTPLGAALALLAVVGIGNSGTDVTTLVVIQRTVPGRTLGRVFGLIDAFYYLSIGAGALIASLLASAAGLEVAMIAIGAVAVVATLLGWMHLVRIDRTAVVPTERMALLRSSRLFAPLPAAALERVADQTGEQVFDAHETIIRKGDPGDRYYLIVSGSARVTDGKTHLRTIGPGEGFGEIALIQDVPRTATVVADEPLTTVTLEREPFLAALSGHAGAHAEAVAEADDRLAGDGGADAG